MTELRADPLSPIDAATLWPQLHRLGTEVIATRAAENLLFASGLAATGITHLPRIPRTAVLGVRRGLSYRGVLIARELSGGAGWEVCSLRLAREQDDLAIEALLSGAITEVSRRAGRTLYLRYPDGSPHDDALKRAGFRPYRIESLYAVPISGSPLQTPFRPATSSDRHGIFRLYCRAVPENVRRIEAPTQQEWRAVLDSYDCQRALVLDAGGAVNAWVGLGDPETFTLLDDPGHGALEATLDVIEAHAGRHTTLVLAEHQSNLARAALERGYTLTGTRLMCARRLAITSTLKEVVAVPAEPVPLR